MQQECTREVLIRGWNNESKDRLMILEILTKKSVRLMAFQGKLYQ